MADGVAITAGSGTTILTDDTGATGHAQVVKLAISTDGSPTLIPADATNGLMTGGGIAHDSADSGNPHKIGAKAIAGVSTGTAVAAADRTNLVAGLDGVLIVRPYCGLEDIVSARITNTTGSVVDILAAQGAGVKVYLTAITLYNSSTANVFADILDGATVKWTVPLAAKGGATINFTVPLAGTANTAWRLDVSAATTTVYACIAGFKSLV